MSKLASGNYSYEKTRKDLLELGVNADVVSFLDRLDTPSKEKLSSMIPEIVEDEAVQVLALLDNNTFKDFMDSQREKKKRAFSKNNVVPFPLN